MFRESWVSWKGIAVALVVVLLAAPLPAPESQAQLSLGDCDVAPGGSIQSAINDAGPYSTIRVCEGTYYESVLIDKDGMRLVGDSAVIDGSLATHGAHGIRLADGVRDILLEGFEIRDFNGTLTSGDPSSGVVALGSTTNVTLRSNTIHSNSFAGLVAATGTALAWNIHDNTFENNGFSHLFVQGGRALSITNNDATGAPHGFVLLGIDQALLLANALTGGGDGAIIVGPSLGVPTESQRVRIHANTVNGTWTHALWALSPRSLSVLANTFDVNGTAITLGGDTSEVRLDANTAERVSETSKVDPALALFEYGPEPGFGAQSAMATTIPCSGLRCIWDRITGFLDQLLPTARAIHGDPSPVEGCSPTTGCTVEELLDLFDQALNDALNPLLQPESASDAQRLSGCYLQPDSCLRSAFFDPSDSTPPHTWTIPLTGDPVLGNAQLVFIDAGLRGPGQNNANRTLRDGLDQEWTTIVLCRLYQDGMARACDLAPRAFDYGLNINWTTNALAQHASFWRLKRPSDGIHSPMDAIHGPDATLFKQTSRPHHANLAELPPEGPAPADPVPDPLREHTAGRLVLNCRISLLSDPLDLDATLERHETCPRPILAIEDLIRTLAWCDAARPTHAIGVHEQATLEGLALWLWSGTCTAQGTTPSLKWRTMFTDEDLADLADAQVRYLNTTDPIERTQHARDAEAVFERAAARHIALLVPDHGMPATLDTALFNGTIPRATSGPLPDRLAGTALAWTGEKAYLFGGDAPHDAGNELAGLVVEFDPTSETALPVSTFPGNISLWGSSAVWTGSEAYVFGGLVSTSDTFLSVPTESSLIWRYDPATSDAPEPAGTLPLPSTETSAVWDGRDLPHLGCPEGCAYLFGIRNRTLGQATNSELFDRVLRFNPATGSTQLMNALVPLAKGSSAAWTGTEAIIVGGHGSDKVHRFDPVWDQVTTFAARLPTPRAGASTAWDGTTLHVFGGAPPSFGATSEILAIDPARGTIAVVDAQLPSPRSHTSAIWTGLSAYILGGLLAWNQATSEIVRYAPSTDIDSIVNEVRLSATAFDVVDLDGLSGPATNVRLNRIEVPDVELGWTTALEPALVAFTPAKLTFDVSYLALNGDLIETPATVLLEDEAATFIADPIVVEYGGKQFASFVADDGDNLDPRGSYADPSRRIASTLTLVELLNGTGQRLEDALFDAAVELPLDLSALEACVQQLWTGRADGEESNLVNGTRLAVEEIASCELFQLQLNRIRLELQIPLSITLEYRQGNVLDPLAFLKTIHEPLIHITDKDALDLRPTLDLAETIHLPTPLELAVETASLRLVVEVPSLWQSGTKAEVLGDLILALLGVVNVVAVEIDDLPAPVDLIRTVEKAILAYSTIILAPIGTLPARVWNWTPEDKLLTTAGLAAHPLVITVGAGSVKDGVSPWSRRGPTHALTPKPDLLLPSPVGTTVGAVMNLVPLVDALVVRGLAEAGLVRAVLAAYSMPVENEAGAPAIFWEQGYGALDLGEFLELPSTIDLLSRVPEVLNRTVDDVAVWLNTTTERLNASKPEQILGAVSDASALLRSAVSATLINLTLDSPLLPHTSVADFGVVNNGKRGSAYFGTVDLDPIVNVTARSVRVLLEEAGYTGTLLDNVTADLLDLFSVVAEEGQDVTINVTHYQLFDLLNEDFLYTSMHGLLEQEVQDRGLPEPLPGDPTAEIKARLDDWLLEPYYFAPEQRGDAHMDMTVDWTCQPVPLEMISRLAAAVLRILQAEAQHLVGTAKQPLASSLLDQLPSSTLDLVSASNAAFIHNQLEQVLCLHDVKRILRFLEARVEEWRALKQIPYGAWNQTEMLNGTWDLTPLGAQVKNTTEVLERDSRFLADNATLVLDITIDAVRRAIDLIEQKLELLKLPRIHAGVTGGPNTFVTHPDRTRDAPLGPYVGIATMTSHNVTVYNPLTGERVHERDVTVPTPSFLWNNPTLVWDEAYRDTTPVPGALVVLHTGDDKILEEVSIGASTMVDGVRVSLFPNATSLFEQERSDAFDILADIHELVNQTRLNETLGPFQPLFEDLVDRIDRTVRPILDQTICLPLPNCDGLGLDLGEVRMAGLNIELAKLYSHAQQQVNVTGLDGRAEMPQLFPGSYTLYEPYPYAKLARLDLDFPFASPGRGPLEGPNDDPSLLLHRFAEDPIPGLLPHPSAPDEREPLPPVPQPNGTPLPLGPWDWTPYLEMHGTRHGPFHQFSVGIQGIDLTTVSCADLTRFAHLTRTPITATKCGTPQISPPDLGDLLDSLNIARCILDGNTDLLPALDKQACLSLFTRFSEELAKCLETARCLDWIDLQPLVDHVWRLLQALLALLGLFQHQLLIVPWVRSPTRVLANETIRQDLGFTVDGLLDDTRELNPGVDDSVLRDAIQTALDDLIPTAQAAITVTEPPRTRVYNHTVGQGILHHVTDKVNGQDWFHIGTMGGQNVTDPRDILDQIAFVASTMIGGNEGADRDAVGAFRAEAERRNNETPGLLTSAFNTGLRAASVDKASMFRAGWLPNGTVTFGGYTVDGPTGSIELSASDACAKAETLSALQSAYYACESLLATTRPTVQGLSGIDQVQFANVLLEETRAHERRTNTTSYSATVVERILSKAAALSAVEPGVAVRRTTDGIVVTNDALALDPANPDPADLVPAIGLLHYSTPIPVQEHVQYRVDAEIVLENTQVLMITTAEPLVTGLLLEVLGELDFDPNELARYTSPGNTVDDVLEVRNRVLKHVWTGVADIDQFLAEALGSAKHPLFRVDLLGMPINVEQGARFARAGSAEPFETIPETCRGLTDRTGYQLCERGMVTVVADGRYNYSHVYEWNTKGRGAGLGAERLDVIMIYLPGLTSGGEVPSQKVLVNNFTLQLTTYLGLETNQERGETTFEQDFPIRFRPNVEDWKMLYAVPDQRLAGPSDPDGTMTATVTSPGHAFIPTNEDLIVGIGTGSIGKCPKTNAPGWSYEHFLSSPRGIPGEQYANPAQLCEYNTVSGLRPRHVMGPGGMFSNMTQPSKQMLDALQYEINLRPPHEEFTEREDAAFGGSRINPLNSPLGLFAAGSGGTGSLGPQVLDVLLAPELRQPEILIDVLLDALAPAVDLRNARPYLSPSWAPKIESADLTIMPPALHNFVVMDQHEARAFLDASSNPWDPGLVITARDESLASPASAPHTPDEYAIHGQHLGIRENVEYRTGVVAHAYRLDITQPDEMPEGQEPTGDKLHAVAETEFELLAGHGVAGVGLALRLRATEDVVVVDLNRTSILQDYQAGNLAKIAVEVFVLGAPRTAGSNCGAVPLYDYVGPFFRCTGHGSVGREEWAYTGVISDGCFEKALELLRFAHQFTLDTTVDATTRPWFTAGSELDRALARLTGPTKGLVATDDLLPPEMRDRIDAYQDGTAHIVSLIYDLATCTRPQGGIKGGLPGVPNPADLQQALANLLLGIRNAANSTLPSEISGPLLAVIEALDPDRAANGETPKFIEAAILVDPRLKPVGTVASTGSFPIPFAVEEWATRIAIGALNLTTTSPAGPVEQEVLFNFTADWRNETTPATVMANLPSPRDGVSAIWTGEHAYVFGGRTIDPDTGQVKFLDEVVRYTPSKGEVEVLESKFASARAFTSAVWTGEHAYILGGKNSSASVVRFTPETGELKNIAFMQRRASAGAVWTGDYVYLFGGIDPATGTYLDSIMRYHPATNSFRTVDVALPSPRSGTGAVWTGTEAYILGGQSPSGVPTNVVRFIPGNLSVQVLASQLPSQRWDSSTVWTGEDALLLGGLGPGDAPLNEVVRFDPLTGTVTLEPSLPDARGRAGAVWQGDRAISFGGLTAPDTLVDHVVWYDPPRDSTLFEAVSLDLKHGHVYALDLTAYDEFGFVTTDSVVLLSDVLAPVVDTRSTVPTFLASPTLDVSFRVGDADSGLAVARIDVADTERNWTASNVTWTAEPGQTEAVFLNGSLNASHLLENERLAFRVVAADVAGNREMLHFNVTVDRTLPVVDASFLGLAGGLLQGTLLNLTWNATDATSGLASLDVWIVNVTSPPEAIQFTSRTLDDASLFLNTSMSGETRVEGTDGFRPVPDRRYAVFASAVDRADNGFEGVVAIVDVQVPPLPIGVIPDNIRQWVGNDTLFPMEALARLEQFPGQLVDRVFLNVTKAHAPDAGTLLVNTSFTNVHRDQLLSKDWDVPLTGADPGSYNVTLEAFKGKVGARRTYVVNVTAPVDNVTQINGYHTYGTVSGPADRDVFRVEYNGCSDDAAFTVAVEPWDHPVNVSVGRGALGTDPTAYNVTIAGNGSLINHTWSGAQVGQIYSILVENGGTGRVPFDLRYLAHQCGGGGGGGGWKPGEEPPVHTLLPEE